MVSFADEFEKNQTYRKRKQKQGRVLQNDYPTTVHPHATKKEATEKKDL